MSDDSQNPPIYSSGKGTYEVGYAKPPVDTRFKKGKSGNPKGRRKGAKNKRSVPAEERLQDIILNEAYRNIKVNDGNKQITIPMAQAVMRSLSLQAAKGQARPQRLFLELLSQTERKRKQNYEGYVETLIEYKVFWENELEWCKEEGVEPPEVIPHPDDIIYNPRTGAITIKGPMTKEEKVKWDKIRQRKIEFRESIAEYEKLLREDPDCEYRQIVLNDIAHERKILDMLVKVVPD